MWFRLRCHHVVFSLYDELYILYSHIWTYITMTGLCSSRLLHRGQNGSKSGAVKSAINLNSTQFASRFMITALSLHGGPCFLFGIHLLFYHCSRPAFRHENLKGYNVQRYCSHTYTHTKKNIPPSAIILRVSLVFSFQNGAAILK